MHTLTVLAVYANGLANNVLKEKPTTPMTRAAKTQTRMTKAKNEEYRTLACPDRELDCMSLTAMSTRCEKKITSGFFIGLQKGHRVIEETCTAIVVHAKNA